MLTRVSHTFYGFEPGVALSLEGAVRLHVMGSGSCLDRSLRGLEVTPGSHTLQLPPGESILRSFQCRRYGAVQDSPGVLYLCSRLLVFDGPGGARVQVRHAHLFLSQPLAARQASSRTRSTKKQRKK